MANFVKDTNKFLDFHKKETPPCVIVISDGRFNKTNVRMPLAEGREKGFLYVLVILDASVDKDAPSNILNLKQAQKKDGGGIKLEPY